MSQTEPRITDYLKLVDAIHQAAQEAQSELMEVRVELERMRSMRDAMKGEFDRYKTEMNNLGFGQNAQMATAQRAMHVTYRKGRINGVLYAIPLTAIVFLFLCALTGHIIR